MSSTQPAPHESPPPTPASAAPRLTGLLVAQFCGAFNDNAWKLIVALLAIRQVAAQLGRDNPAFELEAQTHTTVTFVVFTLPLVLFSVVAGVLADRVSKRTVIVGMKLAEVALMAAGTAALWLDPSGHFLPLIVLGLMGVHSALFSPAKYGILPEILPQARLTAGNGLLELWTFMAIITGTAAAGFLLDAADPQPWRAGAALVVISLIGMGASWFVPPVPPARSAGGLTDTLRGAWSALQDDRVLRLAIMGNIFFWTLASLVGQDILIYAKSTLGLSDALAGIPMTLLAAGIGVGAVLAGRLSGVTIELGLIPIGVFGMATMLLAIGVLSPGLTWTLILLGILGIASGLFVVPVNALVQWRAPADRRGAVIAMQNTAVFTGVLCGSLGSGLLGTLGLHAAGIFLVAGVGAAAGFVLALRLLPESFLRALLVLVTKTLYRVRVLHPERVPATGGALLIPNHVSFIDAVLLITCIERPVRFLVDTQYFEIPWLRPFMRLAQAIPIAASASPRVLLRALRDAGEALDRGELVCIFPEGQITRTGGLLPFRRGFARIVKNRTTPIVPIHLDRIWGSIFSFVGGRFLTKWPQRIPYPITISFGEPMPPTASVGEIRSAIQDLGEAAWRLRKPQRRPLHRLAVRSLRRHPLRFAMADPTRPHLRSYQALAGTVALAKALESDWQDQRTVGLLLPPSVPGALTNLAATLSGRTTIHLNYTAGRAGLEQAVALAGLRTVVTSRQFVEKAKLDLPTTVTPIWLEDVSARITGMQRLTALCWGLFAPISWLERYCGAMHAPTMDDIVTIIFSSGSTGAPKGVMLSHFNIDSNIEGALQLFHVDAGDRLLGILPFFHSFGYMLPFWLAIIHGLPVVYLPSPLDTTAVGEAMLKYRLTICIATPTFVQLYLRRCTPEQFGSLRVMLTGAEKLTERLAQTFQDRFGVRPLEGYGATECAPVISVGCPDFRAAGFFQPASRRGSVGQPLPGIAVRIVDPETFAPLPTGTAGMLLVKGSNVMTGYVGRPDLTAAAMRDGWYITGDIAYIDEDGFLFITDRLSRFSKIGGEMVPHGRIETALHEAAGADGQVLAVTGVPNDRKGEQLAVLHILDERLIPDILEKAAATGLSNLFLPRRDAWIKVEKLPLLGSGKLDLRELKRLAIDALSRADTNT
ncbi:MAG: acyl-[ACP]--phospholipid O-acyltransferase [Nitrospiraceae bacterium]